MKFVNFIYQGFKLTSELELVYTYQPTLASIDMDTAPILPGISLSMYLELNSESYSAFARRVPCHPSYPRMLALGLASPSYRMAIRIETLTDGMVPRSRWFPPEPASPKVEVGDI